jgi:5-methylcytosine-specific restriction endonuclease McrA
MVLACSHAYAAGYVRKDWPHWEDLDADCQNTRAEILIRDSRILVQFKGEVECRVVAGEWFDPYTGQVFTSASDVDIDHVIPLAHAYRFGGASWSRLKRLQFANDPDNLIAVDDQTNQGKGSKSPIAWMPPREEYWCEYLARWKMIEARYGLRADSMPKIICL